MAKLSTMSGSIEQRVCLFGPPKVGKTQLAGELAEHYKILFFSLENGHVTLTKMPMAWQENVDVINIRDSRVYPIAIETMMKIMKGKECFMCVEHCKIACPICKPKNAPQERICLDELGLDTIVVVDSLTQLTNSGIAHITKSQPDDYKLQLDDWGALKVLMDKFLSQIQVAKYNVICISHEEEVKFEDGRVKIVPVAGSANSSRNTAKYFDHVVYCNVINKKHVVGSATDYSISVLTGSRTDVKLEAKKEDGSLLDIFTNWKLPNFGMKEIKNDTNLVGHSSGSNSNSGNNSGGVLEKVALATMTPTRDAAHEIQGEKVSAEDVDVSSMTPGQRALYNLKQKVKNGNN